MNGKYRNFDKFPLLSLLADTSGGSKLSKIEISILSDYGVELKQENCLVLVLLDAGILVHLCNGTLCTAQSER